LIPPSDKPNLILPLARFRTGYFFVGHGSALILLSALFDELERLFSREAKFSAPTGQDFDK
jgi:hypothetical protein